MLANLKPYTEMKDSGVEWLGEVPAHWQIRRVRSVAQTINNGATPSSSIPAYWDGDITWITPEDLGARKSRYIRNSARKITDEGYYSCGTSLAPTGSLVISTRAPIGHLSILGAPACVNQGCKLLVPNDSVDSAFLYYILQAGQSDLTSRGQGTTFAELSRGKLAEFPVAVPPLIEQVAIVRFLDHADRRIQRYIRAKEKLIALLEEQKQVIIHEAVTGRIDVRTGKPYPTYKPSGVEWLGEVPALWERKRFKELLETVDRRSLTGRDPLLSLRRDYGVVFYADHFSHPSQSGSLVGFKLLKTGQLVINRLQANNGLIFCSTLDGLVSPDYSVFDARVPVEMGYLSELCRTSSYRAHFRRESKGLGTGTAGFLRLYDAKFLDTVVFLPSLPEQKAVLAYSERVAVDTDDTIDRARRQLDLLLEFRTRLIADVVTGKIDVREAAAALAEEPGLSGNDRAEVEDDAGIQTEALEMTDWDTCPAVERKPGKVSGAWVFAGTRIPLSALYENLASGATVDEFVEWFPGVDEQQVRAVLEHEAKALKTAAAP